MAARWSASDPSGFTRIGNWYEASTKKRLSVYLVTDLQEVPGIANVGVTQELDERGLASTTASRWRRCGAGTEREAVCAP